MLLFCCAFYILTTSVSFSTALQHEKMKFEVVKNKRLLTHSITSTLVRSAVGCVALCTSDNRCCSSNYDQESRLCRLDASCSPAMEQSANSKVMIKGIVLLTVKISLFFGYQFSLLFLWFNQNTNLNYPRKMKVPFKTEILYENPRIQNPTN